MVNPPAWRIKARASRAATTDPSAAAVSDSSYHCPASGPRRRYIRTAQTTASGSTPSYSTSGSAIWAQASSIPITTGTHRARTRSRISQIVSSGTCVPV